MCNINIDECAINPCHNGGTCIDGINGFTCVCPEGYHDTTCFSQVNECLSNPCIHGHCEDKINGWGSKTGWIICFFTWRMLSETRCCSVKKPLSPGAIICLHIRIHRSTYLMNSLWLLASWLISGCFKANGQSWYTFLSLGKECKWSFIFFHLDFSLWLLVWRFVFILYSIFYSSTVQPLYLWID